MVFQIRFGTDGWRGMIAREYTFDNLQRCAQGFATYLIEEGHQVDLRGDNVASPNNNQARVRAVFWIEAIAAADNNTIDSPGIANYGTVRVRASCSIKQNRNWRISRTWI